MSVRLSKTELIVETLRRKILGGEFPGGRLPSRQALTEHFHFSHRPIDEALKILRSEGLINGVRGTGMFVRPPGSDVMNLTRRLVVTIMSKDSYHESEPGNSLRAALFGAGYFPIHIARPTPANEASMVELASLEHLLQAPILGVVYHGHAYWRTPVLDGRRNLRSVCLVWFDSDSTPPGSVVAVDFEDGGYRMAKHLIANGAHRLAIYFGPIGDDVPKSEAYWTRHPSTQMLRGAGRAAAECGLPVPQRLFMANEPSSVGVRFRHDVALLRPFDGILCGSDDLAFGVIRTLRQAGLRVPEDVLVAGCYNTVWSTQEELPISTIDLNSAEMSRRAIALLESGEVATETVNPQLIFRRSSQRQGKTP
ncbi:MAG: GntR family transcriptional regulator [Victivallales bacterium]|nr:GntR family transcriptional regulator [Victivallales bacterium]